MSSITSVQSVLPTCVSTISQSFDQVLIPELVLPILCSQGNERLRELLHTPRHYHLFLDYKIVISLAEILSLCARQKILLVGSTPWKIAGSKYIEEVLQSNYEGFEERINQKSADYDFRILCPEMNDTQVEAFATKILDEFAKRIPDLSEAEILLLTEEVRKRHPHMKFNLQANITAQECKVFFIRQLALSEFKSHYRFFLLSLKLEDCPEVDLFFTNQIKLPREYMFSHNAFYFELNEALNGSYRIQPKCFNSAKECLLAKVNNQIVFSSVETIEDRDLFLAIVGFMKGGECTQTLELNAAIAKVDKNQLKKTILNVTKKHFPGDPLAAQVFETNVNTLVNCKQDLTQFKQPYKFNLIFIASYLNQNYAQIGEETYYRFKNGKYYVLLKGTIESALADLLKYNVEELLQFMQKLVTREPFKGDEKLIPLVLNYLESENLVHIKLGMFFIEQMKLQVDKKAILKAKYKLFPDQEEAILIELTELGYVEEAFRLWSKEKVDHSTLFDKWSNFYPRTYLRISHHQNTLLQKAISKCRIAPDVQDGYLFKDIQKLSEYQLDSESIAYISSKLIESQAMEQCYSFLAGQRVTSETLWKPLKEYILTHHLSFRDTFSASDLEDLREDRYNFCCSNKHYTEAETYLRMLPTTKAELYYLKFCLAIANERYTDVFILEWIIPLVKEWKIQDDKLFNILFSKLNALRPVNKVELTTTLIEAAIKSSDKKVLGKVYDNILSGLVGEDFYARMPLEDFFKSPAYHSRMVCLLHSKNLNLQTLTPIIESALKQPNFELTRIAIKYNLSFTKDILATLATQFSVEHTAILDDLERYLTREMWESFLLAITPKLEVTCAISKWRKVTNLIHGPFLTRYLCANLKILPEEAAHLLVQFDIYDVRLWEKLLGIAPQILADKFEVCSIKTEQMWVHMLTYWVKINSPKLQMFVCNIYPLEILGYSPKVGLQVLSLLLPETPAEIIAHIRDAITTNIPLLDCIEFDAKLIPALLDSKTELLTASAFYLLQGYYNVKKPMHDLMVRSLINFVEIGNSTCNEAASQYMYVYRKDITLLNKSVEAIAQIKHYNVAVVFQTMLETMEMTESNKNTYCIAINYLLGYPSLNRKIFSLLSSSARLFSPLEWARIVRGWLLSRTSLIYQGIGSKELCEDIILPNVLTYEKFKDYFPELTKIEVALELFKQIFFALRFSSTDREQYFACYDRIYSSLSEDQKSYFRIKLLDCFENFRNLDKKLLGIFRDINPKDIKDFPEVISTLLKIAHVTDNKQFLAWIDTLNQNLIVSVYPHLTFKYYVLKDITKLFLNYGEILDDREKVKKMLSEVISFNLYLNVLGRPIPRIEEFDKHKLYNFLRGFVINLGNVDATNRLVNCRNVYELTKAHITNKRARRELIEAMHRVLAINLNINNPGESELLEEVYLAKDGLFFEDEPYFKVTMENNIGQIDANSATYSLVTFSKFIVSGMLSEEDPIPEARAAIFKRFYDVLIAFNHQASIKIILESPRVKRLYAEHPSILGTIP